MFCSLVRESALCPEAKKQSWYSSSPDSFAVQLLKSYCSVRVSALRSRLNSLIRQQNRNAYQTGTGLSPASSSQPDLLSQLPDDLTNTVHQR